MKRDAKCGDDTRPLVYIVDDLNHQLLISTKQVEDLILEISLTRSKAWIKIQDNNQKKNSGIDVVMPDMLARTQIIAFGRK